jgi:large subunit ribosomal protein L13
MNNTQKTFSLKASQIEKKWYFVDAEGKVVGRLASEISMILMGKRKPDYSPHLDNGDNVVVINAEKIVLTGNKSQDLEYFRHSGFPGGKKFTNIKKVMEKNPAFVLEHAIKGMLPKSKMGRKIFKNLKIYAGDKHPHASQNPQKLDI